MSCYFRNVLRGFVPEDTKVELTETAIDTTDFLISDVDDDDQPEIIMLIRYNKKTYLTMLDRKNFKWSVCFYHEIDATTEQLEFLTIIDIEINISNLATIEIKDLFNKEVLNCVAIVDEVRYELQCKLKFESIEIVANEEYREEEIEEIEEFIYQAYEEEIAVVNPITEGLIITPTPVVYKNKAVLDDYDVVIDEKELLGNKSYPTHMAKLVGRTAAIGPAFYTSLCIFIEDLVEKTSIKFDLPISSGTNPELELIEFTNQDLVIAQNIEYIVVKIGTDIVGTDVLNTFIYTFDRGDLQMHFSSEYFEYQFGGRLILRENYEAVIQLRNGNFFEWNLEQPEYVNVIYDDEGILRKVSGKTMIVMNNLKFVENEISIDVIVTQNIVSQYDNGSAAIKTVLGYIETTLRYTRYGELQMKDQQLYLLE